MKNIFPLLPFVFLLAIPAFAQQQKDGTQEIDAIIGQYVTSLNKHDVPSILSFWADDGDLVSVGGVWASGKTEVERMMTQLQSGIMAGASYSVGNHRVRFVKPDVAIVDWQSIVTGLKGPAGKSLGPQRQHVTSLLVKKDGAWKFEMMRPGSFSAAQSDQQQQQQ